MTTLDCKDIKAILSGLVDGEVDAKSRHSAERHLADCKPCRGMVNEAERLNDLLVQEARQMIEPAGGAGALPAGFEDIVLRKTVYAEAYQFAGRRWTSWLGWVAAAACLLLATAIWTLDQNRSQLQSHGNPGFGVVLPKPPSKIYLTDRHAASSVLGDDVFIAPPAELLAQDDNLARSIDFQLATFQPRPDSDAAASLNRRASLSDEDSDALDAAARLLGMLDMADLSNFKDVEQMRQIALYDNVLDRVAAVRDRLSAEDRPAVLAAESILLRLVNGPVSLEDVRLLRDTNASLHLSTQMDAMTQRWDTSSSL